MSNKHTKGPWHIWEKTEVTNQYSIEPSVACVYGDGEEGIANAKIISAAPDLLDALIGLIDFIEIDNIQINQDAMQIAKSAIEKTK